MELADLSTPTLVLDQTVLERNCASMAARISELGVRLRPHMKTAKCVEVARRATAGHFGGITVSTVAEARHFARNGFTDIFYAVGIAPHKLPELRDVQAMGARVTIVTDNIPMARRQQKPRRRLARLSQC